MGSTEDEVPYDAFLEKVGRTFYLDNISPVATEVVLRTAFDQHGDVKNVHFIPNYLEHNIISRCALVEMEEPIQAVSITNHIAEHPFMIRGMPRPVRARPAEVEMFDDRPKKPGRKINSRWLKQTDPDFEVARKMKLLVNKHASEIDFVLKKQQEQELQLHDQQSHTLKFNYKKYEMVNGLISDGKMRELAQRYNLKISDD